MRKPYWVIVFCFFAVFSSQVSAKKYIPHWFANTVTIVMPQDEPPVVVNDTFRVDEDSTTVLNVLSNDSDEALAQVQLNIVSPSDLSTLRGQLVQNGHTHTYTPALNDNGDNYPDTGGYCLIGIMLLRSI